MRYPTSQQLSRRPAHGHTCDVASPTKKPIVKAAADVKEAQATKKTLEVVIWWQKVHTTLARKRTGDAETGWRPTPEKTLRRCPAGAKNSPEKCLVELGRDTRTSTQSRRFVRRKDASWSLNWPSGANLLARKQHIYFLVPL